MNPFEFRQLLRRYRLGQATEQETQRLETWYDTIGVHQQDALDRPEAERTRQRMWEQIQVQIREQAMVRPLPVYRQRWFRLAGSVAAAALVLMGLFGYGLWQWQRQQPGRVELMSVRMNNSQQPMQIQLDDGSQVTLEPGSFLRFPDHFAATKREVFLTGEAFFNISHHPERPFLVITDRIVTRVLGTSFRVKAFGGRSNVSVTVRTGKVSVFSRPAVNLSGRELSSAIVLVPNQRAVYYTANARMVKTLAENPVLLTPESQKLDFNFVDTPLPEVFEQLEKAYGVDFVYDADALSRCTLTARLSNESLYDKLTLISEVTHARHEIVDGQVIIDTRGCTTVQSSSKPDSRMPTQH